MAGPLGLELVAKGIVTSLEIEKAIEYQQKHPQKRIGDILYLLGYGDPIELLNALGENTNSKTIYLTFESFEIDPKEFYTLDIAKQTKSLPFQIEGNKIKVAFADVSDDKLIKQISLLVLSKGYTLEPYLTFESAITSMINTLDTTNETDIDETSDIISLIDAIIRTGMEKRASDIHIEPTETAVRVRYRIDGILITVAEMSKKKQGLIIGRLKAISNMYQEKRGDQDGRIVSYPDYNIRVSSQRNIFGEKFVLRLLKKNQGVKNLFDLGFPNDDSVINACFNKRNSVSLIAAPTGEGKTTTLYSVLEFLNRPEINITTIEDPVEIRLPGVNQIEIGKDASFAGALRTVLRQDPDIILVGEIRDLETAEIAMQSGQTGHFVLSTIHTIDAIEVITRLRKMGISNYDIASVLASTISQRLVRKVCKKCATTRDFTDKEKKVIEGVMSKYNVQYSLENTHTYHPVGCAECNYTGFYDRIAVYEYLIFDEEIREAVMEDKSTIEIRNMAIKKSYKPLIVDAIQKVIDGFTTLDEVNSKLAFM